MTTRLHGKVPDESIVKVSENGILTAVSNGNATITVSSEGTECLRTNVKSQ